MFTPGGKKHQEGKWRRGRRQNLMEPEAHSAPVATVSKLCGKWLAGMLKGPNPIAPLHTDLINYNALFRTGALSRELYTHIDESA